MLLLEWNNLAYHSVKFVAMAAMKPFVLKLSSFAEHRAKPVITGIRDRFTYNPVRSPKKMGV